MRLRMTSALRRGQDTIAAYCRVDASHAPTLEKVCALRAVPCQLLIMPSHEMRTSKYFHREGGSMTWPGRTGAIYDG